MNARTTGFWSELVFTVVCTLRFVATNHQKYRYYSCKFRILSICKYGPAGCSLIIQRSCRLQLIAVRHSAARECRSTAVGLQR